MAATIVSPDASIYGRVTKMSVPSVAQELEELLGAKLVAYIAGVTEARAVRKWGRGEREPRPVVLDRLRTALRVALMIAETDGPGVAQAWFQGLNPQLDDRSPARLLREGDVGQVGPEVLGAARSFVAGV
ncbi:MAG: hypothetical protein HW416_3459 [Chloroflexi bacterium]|nr:hypothetical protein [Chloroflexota bacterium]